MYGNLTNSIVDIFIEELRSFWSTHPRYKDLVDNIQGKFVYKSRPQRGIVVKTSGGSNIRLQADNFQCTVCSYVTLAKTDRHPGVSLEWAREDSSAIGRNGGSLPTKPGVYYITITRSKLDSNGSPIGSHEFVVTPNYEINNEAINMVDETHGFVGRPYIGGSLRINEVPSGYLMEPGRDYNEDAETGEIILAEPLPRNSYLLSSYYYLGDDIGPFSIKQDTANYSALPGIVLAFGRRITPNDRMAVVVTGRREPSALEYGGRWELSVEIEMWARDVDDQREMTDMMMVWIPSVLRARLCKYGIEIKDTSFGGESEEPYDNTADDYFYGSSMSMSIETDWSIHVPILSRIWKIENFSDSVIEINNLLFYADRRMREIRNLGLRSFEDPYFIGIDRKFESVT